jgi:hypothetical protein
MFQVVEIARIYRCPPHKIGDYSQAHLANIESSNIDYANNTLVPWLVMIKQECDSKFFTDRESARGLHVAHDLTALLRGDMQSRANYYKTRFDVGSISPDEIRQREGDNPIAADSGKSYFVPLNLAKLGAPAPAPEIKAPKSKKEAKSRRERRYNPNHGEDGRFGEGSSDPIARAGDLGRKLAEDPDPVIALGKEYPKAVEADPEWEATARDEHDTLLDEQAGEVEEQAGEHKQALKDLDKEQAGEAKDLDRELKDEAKEVDRDQVHELQDQKREHAAEQKDLGKEADETERQELGAAQAEEKQSLLAAHAAQKQELLEEHARKRADALEEMADARKELLAGHAEEKQELLDAHADARKEFISDKAIELHDLEQELE